MKKLYRDNEKLFAADTTALFSIFDFQQLWQNVLEDETLIKI